jgi:glyoxylase-like metal-dependent hydrolase (beta-lactamase superfamily II)
LIWLSATMGPGIHTRATRCSRDFRKAGGLTAAWLKVVIWCWNERPATRGRTLELTGSGVNMTGSIQQQLARRVAKALQRLASVVALGAIGCSAMVQAADTFTAIPLADNIHLVQGPAGNTLVAADSDGLILIEGVPAEQADDYLAFVKQLTGQGRIKALVNTHWHPESAGLNATLAGTGTQVIAHFNTRQWLGSTIRQRGDTILHTPVAPEDLPDTVFHDKYSIPFGSGSIELGYLLQAHTDGDIYASFPQQKIFFTGPVLRADGWSVVDETTTGFIGGMMDALEAIDAMTAADTTFVTAGGPAMDKAGFTVLKNLYKGLYDAMVAELRKARSAEEVVIANPAAGLKPEWGDASAFLDQGFRSFYGHLRNTRHVGVMP